MLRLTLRAAIVAAGLTALTAPSAFAGYGAVASDPSTGKVGMSWDKPTLHEAEAAAIHDCGGGDCKIVTRTKPHQCSAIATSSEAGSTAWGGSVKTTRAAAQLAAMNDCEKHTKGQCKVRAAGCNR